VIPPYSFVRLGEDNPHRRAYDQFRAMLYAFLTQQRGRQSQLARHLRITRQSAHRWFACPHVCPPAWVMLSANVWLNRQLTLESRTTLLAAVCPPGGGHLRPTQTHPQATQKVLI